MNKSLRTTVSFGEDEVEALDRIVGRGKRYDKYSPAIRKAVLIADKFGWPDLDKIEGANLDDKQG